MSRFKLTTGPHHKDFEQLEEAKRYGNSLPKGTIVKVHDTLARQGDTATYTFVAGEEGCGEKTGPGSIYWK